MNTKTDKQTEEQAAVMLRRLKQLAVAQTPALHQAINEIKIGDENKRSQAVIDSRAFRELCCKFLNNEQPPADPELFLLLLR